MPQGSQRFRLVWPRGLTVSDGVDAGGGFNFKFGPMPPDAGGAGGERRPGGAPDFSLEPARAPGVGRLPERTVLRPMAIRSGGSLGASSPGAHASAARARSGSSAPRTRRSPIERTVLGLLLAVAVLLAMAGEGRPLSGSLSATVIDTASASVGDAANGDGDTADDALAVVDGLIPDEATQALFGERRLTDARLAALNRPGNRNGSYDSPAPTQTPWSATLVTEVMYRDGRPVAYGYDRATERGSLSPDEFSFKGIDYSIVQLVLVVGAGSNDFLVIEFSPSGGTVFRNRQFTLQIGDRSFSLADAGGGSWQFNWRDTGLSWGYGDTVSVRLLRDPSQGPSLEYAMTTPTGGAIYLNFDMALDDSTQIPASAFTVEANGVPLASTDPIWVTEERVVYVALSRTIYRGQTVTVSYADPSTGDDEAAIQHTDGTDVASFTNQVVTNVSNQERYPDPPAELSAEPGGTGIINLTWSTPGYNGGSDILGYKLEVSSDDGTTWTVLEADTYSTNTTYEHSGLSAGMTRRYRVSAMNDVGTSDPSNEADATVPDLPVVSVVAVASPVSEGERAEFRVSRTGPTTDLLTVPIVVQISGGYESVTISMRLLADYSSRVGYTQVDDDEVVKDDITVTWTLQEGEGYSVSAEAASAEIIIEDNDSSIALTASFSDMPASHTGERFTFSLVFSEEFELSYKTLRDKAFDVTGGTVRRAQRQQQGSNLAWNITVEPASANDTVTITLPETTDCGASGAICTEDGRPLAHSLSSVVAGAVSTPAVSVSDASAAEGDAVAFTVSLSAASSQQVTVDYATSDGTAAAGSDYTAQSGTLTFAANETTKTVSVATTDDSADEENETFTLTLSSPANATLGDATATGTINDNDNAAPLTASFSDIPASHTGAEFTFGLTFSEEVEVGYVTLRDTAFAVTGGEVRQAQRQQQGSNLAWNIKVEPASANDTVIITLPETTNCGASGAICTEDGRPLSQSLSATVVDAASASAGDAANGDAADDPLALLDDLTTDEATEALFGERRLGEARLEALDRLGNQNGRYDLGDLLSWIERCRRGEARCGRTPADPGPASAAALLGAAALGRRRISKRPKRRGSGRRGRVRIRGMRRRARMAGYALAMLLAATMAWSCTGDFVGPPDAGQGPGFLTVEWTGPEDARDIGVLLELEGPGIETVRAPGLDLYESRAPGRHQIIVAGSLRAGPVVQFRVPDRGQPTLYRVRILQVTGEDYGLRDVGEYQAVITPH